MDLLVAAVGKGNAKDLLFTARVVDATEALRIGLVNGILPKHQLTWHVDKLAVSISNLAPMTISAAKKELQIGGEEAARACAACYSSADYEEGVASFQEKRRAVFQGR